MTIEQRIKQYQAELEDLRALGPGFALGAKNVELLIEALKKAAKKEKESK